MSIFEIADRFARKLAADQPYQPTEEELDPKDPWGLEGPETERDPEEMKPWELKPRTVEAPQEERQLGEVRDPEEEAQTIRFEAIGMFITAEAQRQGLDAMPDLVGLTINKQDEQLLSYDKVSRRYKPVIRRMRLDINGKELTKLIRDISEKQ